jgi:hypothetical protein
MTNFELDLKKFAKETGLELELVCRKIALNAYDKVTKKTPVQTGRARGNWNTSVDKADTTIDESATQIKTPSFKQGDGKKVMFIANSLPYINRLEHGWSKQARNPNGMVSVTMAELKGSLS